LINWDFDAALFNKKVLAEREEWEECRLDHKHAA
jgi:hypothetical protein